MQNICGSETAFYMKRLSDSYTNNELIDNHIKVNKNKILDVCVSIWDEAITCG